MAIKKQCLIIDHYDSFTYNITKWVAPIFSHIDIVSYNRAQDLQKCSQYHLIIISPGPGRPTDYPETLSFIKSWIGQIPIFGICLGMQMLGEIFGHHVKKLERPLHGRSSKLLLTREIMLFKHVKNFTKVAHYHSLMLPTKRWKMVSATDSEGKFVMAIEDKELRILGVQFHPESFLTESSELMATNLHRWCESG